MRSMVPPRVIEGSPSVFCCNERGEVWSFPITILEQKSQWAALEKERGGQDSGVLKLLSQSSVALISFIMYLLPSGRLCFVFSFTYFWPCQVLVVVWGSFSCGIEDLFSCGMRGLSLWHLSP